MMKFLITVVIAIASTVANASTVVDQARATPWTTANLSTLKQIFNMDNVNTFFSSVVLDEWGNPLDPKPTVCHYWLANLHNDQKIEMVLTVSYGGTGGCTHLYVIDQAGTAFKQQQIDCAGTIDDLSKSIIDLNNDGKKELLIPRILEMTYGGNPRPIINDVYSWNGSSYVQSDKSFKDYYRYTLLPAVQTQMDDVQKWTDPQAQEERAALISVYQKEINAINAILSQ